MCIVIVWSGLIYWYYHHEWVFAFAINTNKTIQYMEFLQLLNPTFRWPDVIRMLMQGWCKVDANLMQSAEIFRKYGRHSIFSSHRLMMHDCSRFFQSSSVNYAIFIFKQASMNILTVWNSFIVLLTDRLHKEVDSMKFQHMCRNASFSVCRSFCSAALRRLIRRF